MSSIENVPKPPPKDENPPAKPPRPPNPRDQALQTLQEAFPTIDKTVIKAILTASGGNVEPAFAALLEMSDPEAAQREQPPARPPRPAQQPSQPPPQGQHPVGMSQVEADELYARQLAEHYEAASHPQAQQQSRPERDRYNSNLQGSRTGRPGANPDPDDVHWRSFIDGANEFRGELSQAANEIWTDDLPEIKNTIQKGFFETQKTVNSWLTNFKKNLTGEDEPEDYTAANTRQNAQRPTMAGGPAQTPQRKSGEVRRSADYARYDADPQVIGDDFSKLDLKEGDHPPRTTSRPAANPNLFRESSKGSGRKVSFQAGPPEEIRDMYTSSPKPALRTASPANTAGKSSKWQPLSVTEASPVGDNDPFSLGDSDDEKDAKPITMLDPEADKDTIGAEASAVDTESKPDSKKATVEDDKK